MMQLEQRTIFKYIVTEKPGPRVSVSGIRVNGIQKGSIIEQNVIETVC